MWRWFDDSMLDCCEPIDVIKLNGITLPKLACVARCNNAGVELFFGVEVSVEKFRNDVKRACSKRRVSDNELSCVQRQESTSSEYEPNIKCCKVPIQTLNKVIIVSYHRGTLNQTGTGHFSPIGGYNEEQDLVLIMDVARFKYSPHWVPLTELHKAMCEIDPSSNRSRGYMSLSSTDELLSYCACHAVPEVDQSNGVGCDHHCNQNEHASLYVNVPDGRDNCGDGPVPKCLSDHNKNDSVTVNGLSVQASNATDNSLNVTAANDSYCNKRKRDDSGNGPDVESYKSQLRSFVRHECKDCRSGNGCSDKCK